MTRNGDANQGKGKKKLKEIASKIEQWHNGWRKGDWNVSRGN
jgi:hypothetical protein